ncbi:MerR family transcriptional regulator [Secundilactobacillus oryzae JCM 18671]|uniref:MerR family transcriptional regulator n=1 Tax=Secundilactobacillus oryzae JCM 18671 TaxID=1291743 RepID=A0A081BGZ5_9LACO|nr:MerR family transcriptional regulator [Secundilactobacillus oryzae]GAK47313.1 MerR family transcriptional regulator [Secundilactobacillus oryzae JCM 18671]
MAYQTEAFAKLTGVSARTLRYYHERGLLVPQLAKNGYREYTSAEADRLQLILLYRSLEFTLTEIEKLLTLPHEQLLKTLEHQRVVLQQRQAELATNLAKLDATLANQKGELIMTDQAKFEQFKQDAIKENDRQYGAEVIDNYCLLLHRKVIIPALTAL